MDSQLKCSRIVCYTLAMAVEWTQSASRHNVTREDAIYAITHAEVSAEVEGKPGEQTVVYIGHPHGQTERYLEVIAALRPPKFTIFHAMELTDIYRHLLYEGEAE